MALAVFSIKMVPRSSAITNLTKRKKKRKEMFSKQNLEMTHTHQQSQESSNQKEK